ncbi:MAG TPA: RNA polymerase sigma factor [Novosphingobium sp.]|nr:RNA polymerase sigma factor [Novosphingobium sp.]
MITAAPPSPLPQPDRPPPAEPATQAPPASRTLPDPRELESHRPTLRQYFTRRIRDAGEAEDYVQDVYLRVLAAGQEPKKIHNLRGFLLRAASSVWIDRHRRAKTRIEQDGCTLTEDITANLADTAAASPERTAIARDALRRLSAEIDTLPPTAREAFRLVRIDGLSHKEAARRLGLEPRQVAHHVERSLARLGQAMLETSMPENAP